jgi:hypothetical protein
MHVRLGSANVLPCWPYTRYQFNLSASEGRHMPESPVMFFEITPAVDKSSFQPPAAPSLFVLEVSSACPSSPSERA